MKNMNEIRPSGRLYDYKVNWAEKRDGTPVMNEAGERPLTGRVELEINSAGNTVIVDFFAYPTWPKSGKPNGTFAALKDMMDGKYVSVRSSTAPATDGNSNPNTHHGKEPEWFSFVAAIEVNYFISKQTKELARSLKIRGSFINDNKKKEYGIVWTADTIITQVEYVDADAEKDLPAFVRLNGYIADYRENLSDVSFQVRSDEAIAKLPVQEASMDNPFYIMLRGAITYSTRVVKSTDEFGDEIENNYENRTWEVLRYALESYDIFDEEIMGLEAFQVKVKELEARKEEVKTAASEPASAPKELDF